VNKIKTTPWLITPEALDLILGIVDSRIRGEYLTDEEIRARLEYAEHDGSENSYRRYQGTGILPLYGPIFGKANLLTEMSGATSMESFQSEFRAAMKDDAVHSILLDIDSPGGTSDMISEVGDEIYNADKPVYAVANTMAGSAAYWLASQARGGLYVTPSGSVGSIGVYTVHEDQSGHDAQEGRRFTYISAGKYKTEGNEHEPLSSEGKEYRQEVVDEVYEEFIDSVARGRGADASDVFEHFGGGRMLTAKKSLEAGMVDAVMPYEHVLGQIGSQRNVTVVFPGGNAANASLIWTGNTSGYLPFGGSAVSPSVYGKLYTESKEWEHSEPGTGSPPTPRTDEDGSDDPAIKSGSRRDPLPVYGPGAPTPTPSPPNTNARGEGIALNLRELLGLNAEATDDEVFAAVQTLHGEVESMRSAVSLSNEEADFRKKFPRMWEEHVAMVERDRSINADTFVKSITEFKQPEGAGMRKSGWGLSAHAQDIVAETHKRFAVGEAGLGDFESCLKAIAEGGTVQYGEIGSSLAPAVSEFSVDTTSAEGIQRARKMFADRVAEIQREDKLDFDAALTEAARRYPELARGYRAAAKV
jgi:signal peptide peptidase SppA